MKISVEELVLFVKHVRKGSNLKVLSNIKIVF